MRFLRLTRPLRRPLRMHAIFARGLDNERSGMVYSVPLISSLGVSVTVRVLITYIFQCPLDLVVQHLIRRRHHLRWHIVNALPNNETQVSL
jgi:hypothetical protein